MAIDPDKLIAWYKKELSLGNIDTLEPLLTLFTLNEQPLSLVKREPMLPIFKTNRPKRMTLQAGRQVSKTMSLGELSILMSGLSHLTSVIVEPRFVQKKAINVQVLTPLLKDCIIQDRLIKKSDIETLDVKKFLSGGQLHLINGFKSADSARGVSGASVLIADESALYDTEIQVIDLQTNTKHTKKICEIVEGDILTSFRRDAILYSVAVRDASFHGVRRCYKITTASERSISCTADHQLPTNYGKLRLSEVFEVLPYVGRSQQRSKTSECSIRTRKRRRLLRRAVECCNGFAYGGWCFKGIRNKYKSTSVESRLEATRVLGTQIQCAKKPCNAVSSTPAESWVWGRVGCVNSTELENASPYLRVDAPKWYENQNYNSGIPGGDQASDCACLVVHGRRLTCKEAKLWRHCHKQLQCGRGKPLNGLVEESLGNRHNHSGGVSQQHREKGAHIRNSEKGVHSTSFPDPGIYPSLHEIQNRAGDGQLPSVRNAYNQGSSQILFSGVRNGVQNTTEKSLGRRASRADKCTSSGMETTECEESEGGSCSLSSQPYTRTESTASGIHTKIQGKESGKDPSSTQRNTQCTEGYSGIQSAETGLGQSLQREVETRSGTFGQEECAYTRKGESSLGRSGDTRETAGEAASLQSSDLRRSGKARALSGERQSIENAQSGFLDARENSTREAEGSRAFEGVSREDQSGSGEVCCETSKGQRVSPQQIYEQDTRGAGSYQCTEEGASCGESTLSWKNHKSSREVFCDDVGGEVVFESKSKVIRARTLDTLRKDEEEFAKKLSTLTPEELSNVSLVVCSTNPTSTEAQQPAEYLYDPIVSIEYVGEAPVYDIEVLGTHNYILANGICSYNCQDLLNENLPVFEAVADAQVDTGFRIYSGTAKTLDGTLAIKFEQSSQGHWCVKCSCGKYNIFSPEEQLFSTITDKGCCCPHCGKKLNTAEGGFVHKFPSRQNTHVGYHLPQIIFPFHHTEAAWTEILYKKNNIPKTQFYNEVLGISDSDSVRLLTKQDLISARNNIRSKEDAVKYRPQFQFCVLGVDWGGGGNKESATGVAVIAKNMLVDHFETLFMARLPQGLTPEQEASFVEHLASEFHVDLIAHDFTGAGFMREAFFLHAFPEWRERVFPVTYSYKPSSELVTATTNGSRTSYVIDKTKSLLMTINCIKHRALTVPWFDPLNAQAPQLDFLAIIEHEQKTGESSAGGQILKASSIYLLEKAAGVKDDAAQAVNIGFIAMCHTLGYYPVLSYDSKYDITEEQYRMLDGDES